MILDFVADIDFRGAEKKVTDFVGKTRNIVGGIASGFAVAGATIGAALAAGAATIQSMLGPSQEMEAASSKLTTLMGSATAAHERLKVLFDFAAKTPFELGQVVGAEVTLRGFGAAADELLPGLIDFAAVTGTDLSQAAIDFGKAWNVGATGLESDGGKILRKQIELQEGVNATKLSIEEFRAAMLKNLSEGMFVGGADKLSQTMTGMMSNLSDEWNRFRMLVGDAGLFNNVKGALSVVLELIGQNRDTISEMAGVVSTYLWNGIKLVAYGAASVADVFRDVYGAIQFARMGVDFWGVALTKAAIGANQLGAAIARAAGQDTTHFDAGIEKLRQLEGALTADGRAARDWLAEAVRQPTILQETVDFFGKAEERAKGYGNVLEDLAESQKKANKAAEEGKKDKDAEKEQKRFEQQLNDALNFADQMRGLNQSESEALTAEYQTRLDDLEAYHQQGLINGALYTETKLNIDRAYSTALESLNADTYARLDEMRQADLERERQAQQQKRDLAYGQLSAVGDVLGAIDSLMDESNAEQKRAHKALAASQIVISGAVAGAKAFEQFGWPGGLIPFAAVAAQTTAQLVSVARAHQGGVFLRHQGGTVGGSVFPDELRILRSEIGGILNSQAASRLGEQGVMALNAGQLPGGGGVSIRIGRVESEEITRFDAQGRGPITDKLLKRTTSGNLDSGFTGRRALA